MKSFFKWITKLFRKNSHQEIKSIKQSIFDDQLRKLYSNNKIDENFIQSLESNLIKADIGIKKTGELLERLKSHKFPKNSELNDLKSFLKNEIINDLKQYSKKIEFNKKPYIILFNGVNGSGKTTSLGKLANFFSSQNKKTLVVACDTYRAAAVEQLKNWAERVGCKFIQSEKEGGDPAALAYKAIELAQKENFDIVLIDTAGRLQNNVNLMDQLGKVIRVIKKLDQDAPHLSLLVVDGTTGQNAIKQLEIFKEYSIINGLIITKLDGTAKGGVILPIIDEFKTPIYFTANGEKIDDIEIFDPNKYVTNKLGL